MGVAEPFGISTSLTYNFPQKGFTPWSRNGKAILILSCCCLYTELQM